MRGIGDWVTGVLEKDGAPVGSAVPKEGGIQWTESYTVVSTSTKKDIVKKYIQYTLSPEGQVRSANMAAYPGFTVTRSGMKALQDRLRRRPSARGRSRARQQPDHVDQRGPHPLSRHPEAAKPREWNEFWSEYKNA